MKQRMNIKKLSAYLLVMLMLFAGALNISQIAYAEPETPETAPTEVVETTGEEGEAQDPSAVTTNQEPAGIAVNADEEEEEEGNIMETLLSADRTWLRIFGKIVMYLAITLGILLACVVAITIYIMITQTTRLSKQNKQMERRPEKSIRPQKRETAGENVHQVTQFGDTLRIKRTVPGGTGAANMARPAAPQRPSRPMQNPTQPGVRRPVQNQPIRRDANGRPIPAQRPVNNGQPQRPMQQPIRQPQRPAPGSMQTGQPQRRPVQNPAQANRRPLPNGAQPMQRPQQHDANQPPRQ